MIGHESWHSGEEELEERELLDKKRGGVGNADRLKALLLGIYHGQHSGGVQRGWAWVKDARALSSCQPGVAAVHQNYNLVKVRAKWITPRPK